MQEYSSHMDLIGITHSFKPTHKAFQKTFLSFVVNKLHSKSNSIELKYLNPNVYTFPQIPFQKTTFIGAGNLKKSLLQWHGCLPH